MPVKTRQWGCWVANEEHFARGGQGLVYRVQDSTNQRSGRFVLKELLNPKRRERFEKEIEAISRLTPHSNVIDVVDHGAFKDSGKPTYVMPEADGSLENYIKKRTVSMTVDESLHLFDQISAGVEHLHKYHIIHRDIKPDNVLMFGDQPKVSDFGLCLIADTPRVTPTEEAVGPRFYMAPELEDGRHLDVKPLADIYSLGKVLYFLLSGGKVFSREKFRDPKWSLSEKSGDDRFRLFDQIFERTIAPQNQRYKSCEELRADVLRIREEYRSNPRSTLEIKVPNVTTRLEGTREQLHSLSDQEWIFLLDLRSCRNAPYSETIVTISDKAISKKTAESFGKEFLRVRDAINSERLTNLAAQVVAASEGAHHLAYQDREDLYLLALESSDPYAPTAVAKYGFPHTPLILEKLATHVQELDEECLNSFLIASSDRAYSNRKRTLLSLSRGKISQGQLGFVIAGLMHDGSEPAITRIAELLREQTSIGENPEIIQGLALRATQQKLEQVFSKGGYSSQTQGILALLLAVSSKSPRQIVDEYLDDFDSQEE